jgi:hypothetical protein
MYSSNEAQATLFPPALETNAGATSVHVNSGEKRTYGTDALLHGTLETLGYIELYRIDLIKSFFYLNGALSRIVTNMCIRVGLAGVFSNFYARRRANAYKLIQKNCLKI